MKQQEKTELTRKKIIAAGINEFGTKGYSEANINNISNSGISKGLIYHNFSSKDELYLECLNVCFSEITVALACPDNISEYSVYFDKRITLFKEKRSMSVMVLEALINPPNQHISSISKMRKQYDEMNTKWIMKILNNGNLRKNVDIDNSLKYLAIMQDMFNWYCTSPNFECSTLENMIESHERELPKVFEYLLFGIMKGE